MLFLPDPLFAARSRVLKDLKRRKLSAEQAFRRMLELEPADCVAMTELARLRHEAGNLDGACQWLWRAIDAVPCRWMPYIGLSTVLSELPGNSALEEGLSELGFRLLSLDEEALEDFESLPPGSGEDEIPGWDDLSKADQLGSVVDALRDRRDLEPVEVTARLRPYRLILQLVEDGALDSDCVDALVKEGPAIVPLLVGVLRGWAQEFLSDDDTASVESALALLGEIGDASAIPHLAEFAALDDPDLAGAANWALERIERPHPAVVAKGQPPWTVYDICAGEVDWEGKEDYEEFLAPPQPVRKAPAPGRNDPCWCGSGKKYKKCHLDADERPTAGGKPAVRGEFDGLRNRLGDFLMTVAPKRESRRAMGEFFGNEEAEEEETLALVDWMIHDWIPPSLGHTVMQEFLRRHGDGLPPRQRELVDSWSRSHIGLYEVQEVREGTGAEVKDRLSGDVFFVHDVSLSRQAVRWDGLLVRVVEGERGTEMTGAGLQVPRRQLEALEEWMKQDRKRTGLAWPDYLKRNWPRIRRQSAELSKEWYAGLQLRNSDGEDMLLSKSVYRILDERKLVASLKGCPEVVEDEARRRYTWLRGAPGEEGRTILGSIGIQGGELVLECNSRERQARARGLLDRLAGGALKHLRDESTTQQELKRRVSEKPRESRPAKKEIPPEVEMRLVTEALERHYARWLDVALPALGGKTPRQATKTDAGRRKLAMLLRDLENAEERKRKDGEPFFNVARLRAELGIEE